MSANGAVGVIDIHCHLLPNRDDGSKSWEETESMLMAAADQGIAIIAGTVHATPQWKPFPLAKYKETLSQANELCARLSIPIKIVQGCEIMYAEDVTERHLSDGKLPTIANTNYALVEFMPDDKLIRIQKAVTRIRGIGVNPIIAHVERYAALVRSPSAVSKLKELGALIQVNYGTFSHSTGFMTNRFLKYIISQDLIDFLATDAHDSNIRKVNRVEGLRAARHKFGEKAADTLLSLTYNNIIGL